VLIYDGKAVETKHGNVGVSVTIKPVNVTFCDETLLKNNLIPRVPVFKGSGACRGTLAITDFQVTNNPKILE
jgi:hypothetical protein